MAVERFVGRNDAVKRLAAVLTGTERAEGKLTVQSIEGPGGIGKTRLFDHVLAATDLTERSYLTLRIDGSDPLARSMVRCVARLVDGADARAIRDRPSRYYFPAVHRVLEAIETIRAEAVAELQKQQPNDEEARAALGRRLDLAFEAGKRLNDSVPATRKYLNFRGLEKDRKLIEQILPALVSLREERGSVWELAGLFSSPRALRNAIRENACRPLADAFVSDLSAILDEYRSKDWLRGTHRKVKGIDRLLLILDDYEMLQEPMSELLVGHLLPALRTTGFQTTVLILGRDQLEATHPAWDQHLKSSLLERISLDPLSRSEMDELVDSYGVRAPEEKERAWLDTQGYPFYVQLWIEEVESGGRSALMLKRFHDRTTRWMSDREKRWLQHTLFLDAVNIRSLRGMLDNEAEAEEAFRWFEREGSVRDTAGSAFRVREYLRSRLVDYLRASDPDRCEELERRSQSLKG